VSSWRRVYARTNTIVMRLDTQGLVRQLNDNVYTVDLEAKIYSCIVFQENSIPYSYAITTIFARPNRNLTSYIPELLSILTWKKTYTSNFPLIDISDLIKLPLSECYPPLTRVPRGRPKKERFRKDKIRGPRGEATTQAMAEPARDADDEV
jgi:hypothetical protein